MRKTDQWTNHTILMVMFIILTHFYFVTQADSAPLQTTLDDLEVGGDWIYDDLEQGIALAKESGKPLFVLFR